MKLGEIASGVAVEDRFTSSVNNSDLWDDDLTTGASLLLLRVFCSAGKGCQEPLWEMGVMIGNSLLCFAF